MLAIFEKIVYTNLAPAGVMELVDVVDSKPPLRTRAPPVAEEARVQQVQRSARDAGVHAKDIRRVPQTMAT